MLCSPDLVRNRQHGKGQIQLPLALLQTYIYIEIFISQRTKKLIINKASGKKGFQDITDFGNI